MRVVGLISGGKDSCYGLLECVRQGHEIVALATLHPGPGEAEERDSYMFQTVGVERLCPAIAECMGLPLVSRVLAGRSVQTEMDYVKPCEGDEVEDLFQLLADVKEKFPEVEGVSSGAVLSNYQRIRVENVCTRLGLTSLAYLWQKDQLELLDEMVNAGVEAVLVKIASMGLEEYMLGQTIRKLSPKFRKLNAQFGFHACGEGGEYETLTLDCPLFKKRIVLDEIERIMVEDVAFAPVAQLKILSFHLEDKEEEEIDAVSAIAPCESSTKPSSPPPAHETEAEADNEIDAPILSIFSPPSSPFVSRKGDLVYVSGCTSEQVGTLEESVTGAVANLCESLATENLTLSHVAFVQLFVADMGEFARINKTYSSLFESFPAPSRACVELPLPPGTPLVINAFATALPRNVLHVRSISKWAPVCIGPYSQSNTCNNITWVAGQIALDPASMQYDATMAPLAQLCTAADHCRAILSSQGLSVSSAVSLVIYLAADTKLSAAEINDCLKEKLNREEGQVLPPSVILRVPRLPRDVAVELEVITSSGSESTEEVGDSSTTSSSTTVCENFSAESTLSTAFFVLATDTDNLDAAVLNACRNAKAASLGRVCRVLYDTKFGSQGQVIAQELAKACGGVALPSIGIQTMSGAAAIACIIGIGYKTEK